MKYFSKSNKGYVNTLCKFLVVFAGVTLPVISANAAEFQVVDQIHILSTTDAQLVASWGGASHLRLKNNTLTAGSCFRGSEGYLVMHIRDNAMGERMYTMLLAAQLSGLTVRVTLDDQYKNSTGHCYVQRVSIDI